MFDLRKFLAENQLTTKSQAINEVSIQQLETDFVNTGRISQDDFDKILKASKNDSAFATWLTTRVAGSKNAPAVIKPEDIYKYEEYLDIFTLYICNLFHKKTAISYSNLILSLLFITFLVQKLHLFQIKS